MLQLTKNSVITLVPLEIRKDKKNFIVENMKTGDYYEMPVICVDAIEMIQLGQIIGVIEKELQQRYPSEDIDLIDFLTQLITFQLVEMVDQHPLEIMDTVATPSSFQWISPKIGQLFFNHITMIVYGILFILNISLLISQPALLPHYKDLFIFDTMMFNMLVWIGMSLSFVLIHELGHILACRAHELPTRLGIGHRLFLVVLETDMSHVWKLSTKNRNRLYLAGLCFDTTLLFIALSLQFVIPTQSDFLESLLAFAVLDISLRMLYQMCLYMKTDLYYVLENVTGCYNLMENGNQYIKNLIGRLSGHKEGVQEVFPGEERMVQYYGLFSFVGIAISIFLFVIYYLPQLFYLFRHVMPGLQQPITTLPFWDALLLLGQIMIMTFFLLYSWLKKYREF